LGHLQTLLHFPFVLDFRTFLSVDIYYSVYPCPAETFRGSNCFVVFLVTLFYHLSFCDKMGGVIFYLEQDCIFNRSSVFVPEWPKGAFVGL
jgi:hypothetical protein